MGLIGFQLVAFCGAVGCRDGESQAECRILVFFCLGLFKSRKYYALAAFKPNAVQAASSVVLNLYIPRCCVEISPALLEIFHHSSTPYHYDQAQAHQTIPRRTRHRCESERLRDRLDGNRRGEGARQGRDQGAGRADPRGKSRASRLRPRVALRQRHPLGAAHFSSDGCRRQGRHDPPRHVRGESAGLPGFQFQEAVRRRAGSQFPLALYEGAARARAYRYF